MLGQWSETLVWESGALGSVVSCYVSLGLSLTLPGVPLPWLAVLCLPLGFLSPLTVCDFHSKCSGSKDAFISLKMVTFEVMQFI